jgi:hypothetical protein
MGPPDVSASGHARATIRASSVLYIQACFTIVGNALTLVANFSLAVPGTGMRFPFFELIEQTLNLGVYRAAIGGCQALPQALSPILQPGIPFFHDR